MTDLDVFDDTTDDHERKEIELLAQDQDAARVATADIDKETAHHLVGDLINEDVVPPVPDEQVLVHEPSSEAFNSITQLAVFHRGWTAVHDVDGEEA